MSDVTTDRAVLPAIGKLDRAELLALVTGIVERLEVTEVDVARARWTAAAERLLDRDRVASAAADAYSIASAGEQDALERGLRARSAQNRRIAAYGAWVRASDVAVDAAKRERRLYREYMRLWNEVEASR